LGSKAPSNRVQAQGYWKLKVFYVKLRGSAEQQKMGWHFANPFLLIR
jgi:hypothetical protein